MEKARIDWMRALAMWTKLIRLTAYTGRVMGSR